MHGAPRTLEEWTDERLAELLKDGVGESSFHEFKADLPDSGTLSKAACSFANADGGFFVFGVRQKGQGWLADGLSKDPEFATKFTQKLRIEPDLQWAGPLMLKASSPGKAIYVIAVPPSRNRPHVPRTDEQPTFWRRGEGTATPMSLAEIREQFLGADRLRVSLQLLAVELASVKETAQTMNEANTLFRGLDAFDPDSLTRLVGEAFPAVSHDQQLMQLLQGIRKSVREVDRFHAKAVIDGIDGRGGDVRTRLNSIRSSCSTALALLRTKYGVQDTS